MGAHEAREDAERKVMAPEPVSEGDWRCVFCLKCRGINEFGAPCYHCGGYSMSSFQALTLKLHPSDRHIGRENYTEIRPAPGYETTQW